MKLRKFGPVLLAGAVALTLGVPAMAHDHDDPPPPPRHHHQPPPHEWHRGDRYDGPHHVVSDYHRYDLPPPDRHHRWERDDDGNFFLVAVSTGIITDLLLHPHH